MITFKQFLDEVFDSPRPYVITSDSGYGLNTTFKTSDDAILYHVSITKHDDGKGFQYEILFSNEEVGTRYNQLNVSMRNDNKYQIEVMATVVKIVKDYFKKYPLKKGDILSFSASNKELGKIRIYRRFMNNIAREVNGKVDEDNHGFATNFFVFMK